MVWAVRSSAHDRVLKFLRQIRAGILRTGVRATRLLDWMDRIEAEQRRRGEQRRGGELRRPDRERTRRGTTDVGRDIAVNEEDSLFSVPIEEVRI